MSMRAWSVAVLGGLVATPAGAETVSVTLPRVPVAEYKRPYVAGWLEPAGGGGARTIFVWYQFRKGGNEPGSKWLSDLRSWWRKAGRTMTLPADGISGATRGPGTYAVPIPAGIAPGDYVLHVEAARENGGRELVSVPIRLPGGTSRGTGHAELGAVVVAAR